MTDNQLPAEAQARALIDAQLRRAGWHVCDRKDIDLVNHQGVAVREVIMAAGHGRVDYLLFVDRRVVGVIEAKPIGTALAGVQWQSAMYAVGLPDAFRPTAVLVGDRLPFVFEASGTETQYTNGYDPHPRARKVFNFPKPATLARILREAADDAASPTWRAKVTSLPPYDNYDLRPASRVAVGAVERSLATGQHSRSLVQMATGAGKTRMAVTECYRLIRYGGFNRILFLVDRNNLGDQTLREFRDFSTPDDGRKFTELYPVDKLTGAGMVDSSKVVISTIQRVFSVLRGQEVPDDDDPNIDDYTPDKPVTVDYAEALPPETFDLVIVDECHRSIYGLWRGVIEYFDAHILGLTATPTKQTFGFFQQNLVSEYTYAQSVADGVNVDFDVYRIKTEITEKGSTIEAGTVVPIQDRRTRQQRLEELGEDLEYKPSELDRAVTSRAQIRLVLETFRDRLPLEIFPGRNTVPKTLIFAKDDNHAEEIVTLAREVFGKGNDFAAKITYTAKDAKALLQQFRNSPTLRIAVTVDMIATGTDVKPIECVFFMRDVRSRTYFEQMKGRGARTIDDATFRTVTPDANNKRRFVIVDAVGVTEHPFVDAAPLDRNKGLSLKQLMERAANFTITAEEVSTLASRLARLDRELTPKERIEVATLAKAPLAEITRGLLTVVDPDVLEGLAQGAPLGDDGQPNITQALALHVQQVVTPLAGNPQLRQRLLEIRESHDRVIDEVSVDALTAAGGVVDKGKALNVVTSWKQFLEDHQDEIILIHLLYSQNQNAKVTFQQLRELADQIERPPRSWTVDLIWNAYETLDSERVQKANQHTATDLIALVRFTLNQQNELVPYATGVEERYTNWLAQQAQEGVKFSDRQRWWLDRIKDTIIQSANITIDDLDAAPFTERGGVDGFGRDLGPRAQTIITSLSETLAA
ncbi:MAG: DEAD/DEAH box helicase family protein [Actinomycetia bacterium]|nr:DEAD/DEAH box helicase family protein [Actinomycetes bacterium]